jgi:hypothetical protein
MLSFTYSTLVRALLFMKSSFFINPACASPDLFVGEQGRLKLTKPSAVAVCTMMGILTECAIVSKGFTGSTDNIKTVHKVTLAPFWQEFRHDMTVWGKALSFYSMSCAVSVDGVLFTTQPKVNVYGSGSGSSVL